MSLCFNSLLTDISISLPVDIVEDSQTDLSTVRLGSSPASEGPGVLSPGHGLSLAILPAQGATISGQLAASPEIWSTVGGHQSEEVLRLLLAVQGDHLHALGPAVLHASAPVKVVPVVPPGQQIVLAFILIVSLGSAGRLKGLGLSLGNNRS